MRTATILFLTILVVVVFCVVGSEAQGPGRAPGGALRPDGPPPKFWLDDDLIDALGLSDDQIDALEAADNDGRDAMETLAPQIRRAERAVDKAVTSEADDDEIRALAADARALHERAAELAVEHRLAVRRILTADQRRTLEDLRPDCDKPSRRRMK
ncbi:MAG: periplasmic heavy metal sensor [Deltaproteobacteria bacterium]|nr:periplasmic heavy metal sensor [Deltaproteobacteria bacterium]